MNLDGVILINKDARYDVAWCGGKMKSITNAAVAAQFERGGKKNGRQKNS